jgi:hypothetical protein
LAFQACIYHPLIRLNPFINFSLSPSCPIIQQLTENAAFCKQGKSGEERSICLFKMSLFCQEDCFYLRSLWWIVPSALSLLSKAKRQDGIRNSTLSQLRTNYMQSLTKALGLGSLSFRPIFILFFLHFSEKALLRSQRLNIMGRGQ